MPYEEWRIAPDVEVWRAWGSAVPTRILPDGCLDVIVVDGRALVAGPDTSARVHAGEPGGAFGVRLHAGRGPSLLGVAAVDLRDQTHPLAALWGDRRAREVEARASSATQLGVWALGASEPDSLGRRLHALLDSGSSISDAADQLGYSARQLHRLAVPLFGYGLQHLGRVLRLTRAVAASDAGAGWAEVAAGAGYADQAHLSRDFAALAGASPTTLRGERVRSVQADAERAS